MSLQEELETLRAYLFLLNTRFDDRLQVQFKIAESALPAGIVPLALQTLVENAVKHNATRPQPLQISIATLPAGRLEIRNNRQVRLANPDESTGTGLANLRQRYALLGRDEVNVVETATEFVVTLPLLALAASPANPAVVTYASSPR